MRANVGSVPQPCGCITVSLKITRMLGFRRKRTNLREKYDHPRKVFCEKKANESIDESD